MDTVREDRLSRRTERERVRRASETPEERERCLSAPKSKAYNKYEKMSRDATSCVGTLYSSLSKFNVHCCASCKVNKVLG